MTVLPEEQMSRPTFARIDLDAVAHNVRAVKGLVGDGKICAAVKADAYGHGAPAVAKVMSMAGVDMFGVAMTEEAVELRDAGVTKTIILLTGVPEEDIDEILEYGVTSCIAEEGFARRLSEEAVRTGRIADAHVNVDTGMGRVGIPQEHAADAISRIAQLPGLRLTGIFSHFACSGASDLGASRRQLRGLKRVAEALRLAGVRLPMLHMANSCAVLRMPSSYLDCVRPGLILYGLYPMGYGSRRVRLRPVMSLHSRVSFCKEVRAGEKLGYGHTFTTWRDSVIATIPIGYHDGFLRQYSNAGEVLVRGHRAPVVGRVCMDQTLADVTGVPGVRVGDDVVIYGEQDGARITIEEMAWLLDRIPYELTCSVGGRVRRQFVLNGEVVGETPMRSLVPPGLLGQIFPAQAAGVDGRAEGQVDRRGAA